MHYNRITFLTFKMLTIGKRETESPSVNTNKYSKKRTVSANKEPFKPEMSTAVATSEEQVIDYIFFGVSRYFTIFSFSHFHRPALYSMVSPFSNNSNKFLRWLPSQKWIETLACPILWCEWILAISTAYEPNFIRVLNFYFHVEINEKPKRFHLIYSTNDVKHVHFVCTTLR